MGMRLLLEIHHVLHHFTFGLNGSPSATNGRAPRGTEIGARCVSSRPCLSRPIPQASASAAVLATQ